ncbi:hypothetical protein LCGC14_3150260 [marine sediment metagenome]|uniref:NTP pyrophosphohydrolase MazG-like domain-containing protein n=1 Tax=marine sediment metagenome TaxID=412755 RepID=A0A0F8VUA4_9ZZZZ
MSEFSEFVDKLMPDKTHFRKASPSVVHASMGLSEESGEILGHVKKSLWYGKDLDKAEMAEEMGDCLHYFQMLCNSMDITIEELIETNMQKLNIRYPFGYTDRLAKFRDTEKEKKVFTDFVERKWYE